MNNKKTIKSSNRGKLREKCGDCYYNGCCSIALNQCIFLKKKHVQET